MGRENRRTGLGRFMIRVAVMVLIGLFLAVLGSMVLGWRDLKGIGTMVLLVGSGAAVVGIMIMVGNWGGARNFEQQFTKTAWTQDAGERMHQEVKDTGQSYGFAALLGAAGFVLVVIGFALEALG